MPEDFKDNPVLASFLYTAGMDAALFNAGITIPTPITPPVASDFKYKHYRIVELANPLTLFPGVIADWHQLTPYNRFTPVWPTNPSRHTPVGCGPLAMGMLLSKYPLSAEF